MVGPQPFGLLFPGQGAQFAGMGRDLAQEFPRALALFQQADDILGYEISRLCWDGPSETLTRTEHCQPALYLTSLAVIAALETELEARRVRPFPLAAAGLSLGEYTALAAAGALSFPNGLQLVRLRGQAMEEASRARPGTMASVLGLELDQVEAVCVEAGAQVANLNSPGQIVISGTPESITAASAKAKEKGAKRVIPLEVSGAFHSRLMEPAGAQLRAALRNLNISAPKFTVFSNVTGSPYTDAGQISTLLVDQLTRPVQWVACVQAMLQSGIRTFLEVGPGTVLKGLVRKIDPEVTVHSVGTAEEVRKAAALWSA